jgi:hypothetical protein
MLWDVHKEKAGSDADYGKNAHGITPFFCG